MNNTFLQHYGILGMRWGRRRREDSPDYQPSSDHTTYASLRKKAVSELSNEDIRKIVARTQLERQLSSLNAKPESAIKRVVGQVVSEVGKEFAKDAIKTSAGFGGNLVLKLIGKKLTDKNPELGAQFNTMQKIWADSAKGVQKQKQKDTG